MTSSAKWIRPLGFSVCFGLVLLAQAEYASLSSGQEKPAQPAAPSGGVAASEPRFRLIRAVAGTKSSEQGGSFVIEDPRTVFNFPSDQKIIVHFEWEGPPGVHHLEGFWKNPEGKIVVMSDFNYDAKQRRFGAYWTLPITEGIQTGMWALEAHVDGEVAAVQTFQIATGPPAIETTIKKLPTRAEIYKLALRSTVEVQRLGSKGEVLGQGLAFVIKDDLLLTAYDVIDCAKSLRIVLPDGKQIESLAVVASNRPHDWVLLKAPALGVAPLPWAKPDSWSVGNEYFSLDSPLAGGRTLVEGSITGVNDSPDLGKRIHLSLSASPSASGSPVLNEAAEVIGVMTYGSLLPGLGDLSNFAYPANLAGADSPVRLSAVLAIPISEITIPDSSVQPVPIEQFVQAGGLIPPLVKVRIADRGTLARKVIRQRGFPQTEGEKFQYSRQDGRIVLFMEFLPSEKIRSQLQCRVYDLNNRLLIESKPFKLNIDPLKRSDIEWPLDLATLQNGLYRVDVYVGPDAIWRTFFRVG